MSKTLSFPLHFLSFLFGKPDPWKGISDSVYIFGYKQGIENMVEKISRKIFKEVFFEWGGKYGLWIYLANGNILARVNVSGEAGLPYAACIKISNLFPESLICDMKGVFKQLSVTVEYDMIIVIKNEPLTLLLELPLHCIPGTSGAAKAFSDTIEIMKKSYPGKNFTLIPFNSSIMAIENK